MTDLVTNDKMNDAERMAAWATVTDLRVAVAEFLKHSTFVGTDPYYSDLNGALWSMLERCHANA